MAKVINIRERVVAELEKVMELAREGRLTCFVLAGNLQVDVLMGLLELRAEELTDE
ncbi:MAG: hypothetical protein AB1609_00720 [Bacillota bacterium]